MHCCEASLSAGSAWHAAVCDCVSPEVHLCSFCLQQAAGQRGKRNTGRHRSCAGGRSRGSPATQQRQRRPRVTASSRLNPQAAAPGRQVTAEDAGPETSAAAPPAEACPTLRQGLASSEDVDLHKVKRSTMTIRTIYQTETLGQLYGRVWFPQQLTPWVCDAASRRLRRTLNKLVQETGFCRLQEDGAGLGPADSWLCATSLKRCVGRSGGSAAAT